MSDFEEHVARLSRDFDDMRRWMPAVDRALLALEALAAERAAERERQAGREPPPDPNYWQNIMAAAALPLYPPFPRVPCNNTLLAEARVAAARKAAPEPVSVEPGHWGMH